MKTKLTITLTQEQLSKLNILENKLNVSKSKVIGLLVDNHLDTSSNIWHKIVNINNDNIQSPIYRKATNFWAQLRKTVQSYGGTIVDGAHTFNPSIPTFNPIVINIPEQYRLQLEKLLIEHEYEILASWETTISARIKRDENFI